MAPNDGKELTRGSDKNQCSGPQVSRCPHCGKPLPKEVQEIDLSGVTRFVGMYVVAKGRTKAHVARWHRANGYVPQDYLTLDCGARVSDPEAAVFDLRKPPAVTCERCIRQAPGTLRRQQHTAEHPWYVSDLLPAHRQDENLLRLEIILAESGALVEDDANLRKSGPELFEEGSRG